MWSLSMLLPFTGLIYTSGQLMKVTQKAKIHLKICNECALDAGMTLCRGRTRSKIWVIVLSSFMSLLLEFITEGLAERDRAC